MKHSAKLRVVDAMLKQLHKKGHKVLIFSQMTKVRHVCVCVCRVTQRLLLAPFLTADSAAVKRARFWTFWRTT